MLHAPPFCLILYRKQTFHLCFLLNDSEEAGYFYHDIVQANGDKHVLFFPSSYRRAIKYGQKMLPMKFYVLKCSASWNKTNR